MVNFALRNLSRGGQKLPIKPRLVLGNLVLAFCYILAGKLGLLTAIAGGNVTLIWPPTGIAAAALLFWGYGMWPGIALGAFVTNFLNDAPLGFSIATALGNPLPAVFTLFVFQKFTTFDKSLGRLVDVICFVVIAAVASTTISATVGAVALGMEGVVPWESVATVFGTWWLGDAMGVLIVTPLILLSIYWTREPMSLRRLGEGGLLLIFLILVTTAIFFNYFPNQAIGLLTYSTFPFIIWAAIRFSQKGVVTAVFTVAMIAIMGTSNGLGPFFSENVTTSLAYLHGYLAALAIVGMLLGAALREQKIAEKARMESETRFRAVTQSASDGIVSADQENLIVQWNLGAQKMFGYEASEIVGRPVTVLMPERYREAHIKGIRRFMDEGISRFGDNTIEIEALRRDGSEFPIELKLSSWRIGDEKFVTSIIRDISERRRADAELRKLSQTVEQSPSMIFITDTEGNIEYANAKFYEVTGYGADEILGKTPRVIKSGKTPRSVYENLWGTIKAGRVWQGEILDRCKDGRMFWAYITIAPIRSQDGNITHYFAAHEDITMRKKTELKMLEAKEQAMIASRAKSDLLANMSHELRTPLNAIIGFSSTMKEEVFGPIGDDKYREYLNDIHYSGQHLLELINDILDVSAIEAGALELNEENIYLPEVVNASFRLVKQRAQNGKVATQLNIDPDLPLIFADERRVKQVLLNLLSNAIKFTPEGGNISVDSHMNGDQSISLTIADSGIGMNEEEMTMALSTFGQVDSGLDRKHEGTGLGLPLTSRLMELHGGTLEVQSAKGSGTLITITFPKERVVQNIG